MQHIARAALQLHIAARRILGHIIKHDGATGHIQQRVIGQHHIAPGVQCDLATGQDHGAGHANAVALEGQFSANAFDVFIGARRGADINDATGGDAVDRTRLAGHQRGQNVQVAAGVGKTAERIKRPLALIHREAAGVIGGDALAGVEVDVGKPQGQAVLALAFTRLGKTAVAECDGVGLDVQTPAAAARATGDRGRGLVVSALPDQVCGVEGGHISGVARAIDRRGGNHQVVQQGLAGDRIVSIQRGGAVEVETLACRQLQGFQGGRAELRVTAQQAVDQLLVEGNPGRQAIGRCGRRQGVRATDVDAGNT